jgi:hypothetical protein
MSNSILETLNLQNMTLAEFSQIKHFANFPPRVTQQAERQSAGVG